MTEPSTKLALELMFDLEQTLKAVLHFFGPEGAEKITKHVMMARRARDSNAEIDELETLFGGVDADEQPTSQRSDSK